MKIFHRQEMEVIDRLKEIRERGKASKQIQRMCRGHLGRLALKRKRKESNEMEKERRKLIQQKIDDLMDIVNTKLSNSINNAIRSKLNKLVRVMNKHYKAKEEEKKKVEEKEKMELEAETKRKREEAEKKAAEDAQNKNNSAYGQYHQPTFTADPVEIIQKKAKKKKEDEETILIKEVWQRFDPLGFRKILLNDIPKVLTRLGISVDINKVNLPKTTKDGKVSYNQFTRWLKTDALMHLSKLSFLNRMFKQAKQAGGLTEMDDLYRALHEGLKFYISKFIQWEYDYDNPRYLTYHCFLCTKKFHSFQSWRKHKKAPCLGRVVENQRIENESLPFQLIKPLIIPHNILLIEGMSTKRGKRKKKQGRNNNNNNNYGMKKNTFNIFHEYLQDEINYKKINMWYNMEMVEKGDRFKHRKFRRRQREERRYRRRLARNKRKHEFQQFTIKKRKEQAINAEIQREKRIKEAIEKEKQMEEERLRQLVLMEEDEAKKDKKKKKKKKKKKRKKKRKGGEEEDDVELDVDFL